MSKVVFKYGTLEQYNALAEHPDYTLYWLIDVQRLYRGDVLFAVGQDATTVSSGLLSAADKKKLDELVNGSITNIISGDKALLVTKDGTEVTIKLNLSSSDSNLLKLEDTGQIIVDKADVQVVVANTDISADKVIVGEGEKAETLAQVLTWKSIS